MAWLAVDKDSDEYIYYNKPTRECNEYWCDDRPWANDIQLPKGSIKKLIGRELTWNDEPVEI